MTDHTLRARIEACIGKPIGPPVEALDAVNLPSIRRWVDALGERNLIYLDDDAARNAGRPGIVAPCAMLSLWTARGYRETLAATRTTGADPLGMLAEAGFSATPATNLRQCYTRELCPGDRIQVSTRLAAISPEKRTALGRAHFVDLRSDFRDEYGQTVGEQLMRLAAFNPSGEGKRSTSSSDSGSEAISASAAEPLAPLTIPLDRLRVIACTTACNDFRAGHLDPDHARALGFADILIDIPTALGFAARFVGEWAGPASRLHTIDIQLGIPCCAGDTLELRGWVESEDAERARVAIRGMTGKGEHLRGTAVVKRLRAAPRHA